MYLDVVKVWNPFNYWIEKLEKNYDSKCLLWLWWILGLYAIFLSVLLLFPNRDELLEFFLKVSSKKENKTKEGKHACELGLIRTDFRHWAGQSTHIMLPASVLISAVRRQFSAQGFFQQQEHSLSLSRQYSNWYYRALFQPYPSWYKGKRIQR